MTAAEYIVAVQGIIDATHARNIKIYGATLMPFGSWIGYTPAADALRQDTNFWIRNSGAFDAVIDFDAVVQDPATPTQILPAYSADGLHCNDAGYQAMADSIDLALFSP
jgi:lysophospholipase L1-like esterase